MVDGADQIEREFHEAMAVASAAINSAQAAFDRLRRVATRAPAPVGDCPGPSSTISLSLKDAAYIAGISESQMRKRCKKAMYGKVAHGYGYKKAGRWEVVKAPFLDSLPPNARFRAF